ncbi:MAG: hypothetical protein CMN30_25830 [Sandaracinus sp.]|nr:hypothetical protein [Sandaracinus sp.]
MYLTRLTVLLAFAAACAAPAAEQTGPLPEGVRLSVDSPLVLADDVRVPSDDGRLRNVTIEDDGRLRFVYSGTPEIDFVTGQVIVGNEGQGYMGRVLDIAADGDDRLVALEPVGLDEVLAEGAFTLNVMPNEEEFTQVLDDGVGSRADALGGSYELVPTEILDGAGSCEGVAAGQITFRHSLETRGLDTELVFDRSGFTINEAGVKVTGGATLRAEIETTGTVDAQCALDVIDALNRAGVGIRPVQWSKSFRIAGILPVSLSFKLTPQLLTEASLFVEPTSLSAAVMVSADLTAGVVWRNGSGIDVITDLTRDAGFDLDLEEGGDARGNASIHGGLYMRLDINMLQLPQAGAEIDAAANFQTNEAACTYAWDAHASGELWLRGPLGVDLGFFSRTFTTLNERVGFTESASGGDMVDLPYCSADMCTTDADCVGVGETCQDGVCVEDDTCDCGAGEVCMGTLCFPDPAMITTCDPCTAIPGYAWCEASGECIPQTDSCSGDLATSRSACVDCSGYTDCGACAGNGFCGWISSEGRCVNDDLEGRDVPAEDYISTPSWCS